MKYKAKYYPTNEHDNEGIFHKHSNLIPKCESITPVHASTTTNYFCESALNYDNSKYFCSNREEANAWITFQIPPNVLVTNYSLTVPGFDNGGPRNFIVEGKKGDKNVVIDQVTNSGLNYSGAVLTRTIYPIDFYSEITLTMRNLSYGNGYEFRIMFFDVFGFFLGYPGTCCIRLSFHQIHLFTSILIFNIFS